MRSLLSSWGHDAIVAGSGAEMLDRIPTRSRRPDLIICDYRLRDGENGIGVIKRLQSNYNERVPAVLITGDTASDRLQEAQESGLVLLHKPVRRDQTQGDGRQPHARPRLVTGLGGSSDVPVSAHGLRKAAATRERSP